MRSREALVVLLVLAAACSTSSTSDGYGWSVNGVLVPDEPWRGHDGPFLAALFLTDDAEAVYERWNAEPGDFRTGNVHETLPGATVEAVVVFMRCEPDDSGNCQVWSKATVEAGDGRILAHGLEVPVWVGRPPPPDPALGIGEHGVALVVDEASTPYSFRVVVSDRVAQRQVELVESLRVRRAQ